jgi:plasmid stabilization system protein ParE
MDFKIIWSEKALSNLENIVDYLKNNWSVNVLNNFSLALEKKLETLKRFPESGISSTNKPFRKTLVTKHTYLVYKVKGNTIELLGLIDNRQKPDLI